MTTRKATNRIVIHCAATRPSMDWGAKDIDREHKRRGFSKIGYHYVVRRNGAIETGRRENEIGAHAQGFNEDSIAVCWVGGVHEDSLQPEDNRTPEQKKALATVIGWLKAKYPQAAIVGHRDLPGVKKACPSFDVAGWLKEAGL